MYFENQPKLSGAEIDKNRDEKRMALVPFIENFLSTDDLFKGKDVKVEFSHEGGSSLVCFVEAGEDKFVLKIALNDTVSEGSEALFLKTWENAGISTPHVFKDGKFGDRPYLLMQYIDAPKVDEKYREDEAGKEGVYSEAGKILRAMHKPESSGFGEVVDGKGKYSSFAEWIDSPDITQRAKYVEENKLLISSMSFSQARDILVNYIGDNTKSSYCHFDYSTGHLFATEPLTVFDPNPLFNNGYIDLGRTLVNYIAVSGTYPKQIVDGYKGNGDFDENVLQAAIFLNIIYKLPYQHKKGRLHVIQNFQKYLTN